MVFSVHCSLAAHDIIYHILILTMIIQPLSANIILCPNCIYVWSLRIDLYKLPTWYTWWIWIMICHFVCLWQSCCGHPESISNLIQRLSNHGLIVKVEGNLHYFLRWFLERKLDLDIHICLQNLKEISRIKLSISENIWLQVHQALMSFVLLWIHRYLMKHLRLDIVNATHDLWKVIYWKIWKHFSKYIK